MSEVRTNDETIDLTDADLWWDEAVENEPEDESIIRFLEGLDRDLSSDRNRTWVILARDAKNSWRARSVIARNASEAQDRYNRIFKGTYEIVGVANLEGSGHAIEWVGGEPPWSRNTPGSSTG